MNKGKSKQIKVEKMGKKLQFELENNAIQSFFKLKEEKMEFFLQNCLTSLCWVLYYVPVRLSRDESLNGAEIKN